MALRDLWRGGRRERAHEHEHERYPQDPYGRFGSEQDRNYDHGYDQDRARQNWGGQDRGGQDREGQSYGGSGNNPFYGDHPLMRAGSTYDYGYFGSKSGLPTTPWRHDNDNSDFDQLVYGGRPADADTTGAARGQHRGRGPRGYRRSDERIKEDVCQCLTDDHHIDATDIEVAVSDSEVVLSGTVTSRAQKRHAEDLIERLPGVRDVINSLRVVSDVQSSPSTATQAVTQSTRPGGTFR